MEKVLGYIEIGKESGARCCVAGGGRPGLAGGFFVEPTVFDQMHRRHAPSSREEIFGPVMAVLTFDSEDEVVPGPTTPSTGSRPGSSPDLTRAHRVAAALEAGTVWINTYNLTPIEMPFGGYKQSGIGGRTRWRPSSTTPSSSRCTWRRDRGGALLMETLRLRDRRGRLGRLGAGQPAVGRPEPTGCWCSRRAARLPVGRLHPHAGRAAFPIGSRFYDWKYESEPEPFMGGRRVYHARGKVLGGSSSINGMIFQRGNPMDYERWAADPGMETWDYAHCLPYFKRMETCLAGEPTSSAAGTGPLVLERGPPTNPLFGPSSRPCSRRGTPSPTTSTATRRRASPVRPQRPPRPAAERGPGLPAPGDAPPQPRGGHRAW
jgi:choline dehydrogenase-like flavoprotein